MKQADLRAGAEYALVTYKPYSEVPLVARIAIVSIDGGGQVTARVVDSGPTIPEHAWGSRPVKRGEHKQVPTRDVLCPWAEWPDHAAALKSALEAQSAEQEASRIDAERRRIDRVTIDPSRMLPDTYDEAFHSNWSDADDRAKLGEAYVKAEPLTILNQEEAGHLLRDLPIRVVRDILAAAVHPSYETPAEAGTVAATFERAGRLFHVASNLVRQPVRDPSSVPTPGSVIRQDDVAFVDAIRNTVAAAGGELLLPPVPPLPEWADEDYRRLAPALGWLRLAVGDTTGAKLHDPGCHVLKGNSRPAELADHVAWWRVMLEDPWTRLCGVCNGPGVRDVLPLVGFVAASDSWNDRKRPPVERWQIATFQRLLAATNAARAQIPEPDVTLASRITAALAMDPPGDKGWAAYYLMLGSRGMKELAELTPTQLEAARSLACKRLNILETVLPDSQNPSPLPQDAEIDVLRERYGLRTKKLRQEIPQLDRLLFTLPGTHYY